MKKPECEAAIRRICHDWFKTLTDPLDIEHPSYSSFKTWAVRAGYGEYFKFRAVGGPDYVAEMWFDAELGQSWRR